jgi:hypothetical protein
VRRAGTVPIALESLYELLQSYTHRATSILTPELQLSASSSDRI